MKETDKPFRRAILQLIVLVIAAVGIGLGANHLRSDSIAVFQDWSALSRSGGGGEETVIALKEAEELFKSGKALFLDARGKNDFDGGHIKGAIHLPLQNVENGYVANAMFLDEKEHLVCYCDGEACELSHELAAFLTGLGYTNVRVFVNGWTVWRNAGLPVEYD